jgi:hypothetical protein
MNTKKYSPSHKVNQFTSLMSILHTVPEFGSIPIFTWLVHLSTYTQTKLPFFCEFSHHLAHAGALIRIVYSAALTFSIKCRNYSLCTFYLLKIYCPWQNEDLYYISQCTYCSLTPFHTLILTPICNAYLTPSSPVMPCGIILFICP